MRWDGFNFLSFIRKYGVIFLAWAGSFAVLISFTHSCTSSDRSLRRIYKDIEEDLRKKNHPN